MGGRGASSGMSVKGKPYGSEYTSLLKVGNIKFVRYNDSKSAKTPQETMTKGRVYVTINADNNPVSVTYYDDNGKRRKSIDLTHMHNGKRPHTHHGYEHDEGGTTGLSVKEKEMVAFVLNTWYNRQSK